MDKNKYIELTKKRAREEWFKDHQAVVLHAACATVCCNRDRNQDGNCDRHPDGAGVLVINWQKPGTWNYGMRFIIHRQWLMIVGDLGESVFQWGEDVSLKFLSQIDFGYFLSKCRASEFGSKFEHWNSDIAQTGIDALIEELNLTPPDEHSEKHVAIIELLGNIERDTSQQECQFIAHKVFSELSGNVEMVSRIANIGIAPHGRAMTQFAGLQMAVGQILESKLLNMNNLAKILYDPGHPNAAKPPFANEILKA